MDSETTKFHHQNLNLHHAQAFFQMYKDFSECVFKEEPPLVRAEVYKFWVPCIFVFSWRGLEVYNLGSAISSLSLK